MRKHVGARGEVEEIRVEVGFCLRAVVVGILEHAVPSAKRPVGAQHQLSLGAVEIRVGMVVFAHGIGLAGDARLQKRPNGSAGKVDHRPVVDLPVLLHGWMAPVAMRVDIVERCLYLRRREPTRLRAGNRRLKAQLVAEIVAHGRPERTLCVEDERMEVPLDILRCRLVVLHYRHLALGGRMSAYRLSRTVLLHEPCVPERLELRTVWIGEVVQLAVPVLAPERVFVA